MVGVYQLICHILTLQYFPLHLAKVSDCTDIFYLQAPSGISQILLLLDLVLYLDKIIPKL